MQQQANNTLPANESWLLGAPLTKYLALLTVLSYAAAESRNSHDRMAFDVNQIVYNKQFYRIFTGPLCFQSSGEMIMGLLVYINFSRRWEREMGTRKYVVWLIMVSLLATLLQIFVAQLLFVEKGFKYSGPYPTLGALVFLFHIYSPRLYPRFFGIFGIHYSEKSMTYAFAAQVILYRGSTSIIACASGMAAAFLIHKVSMLKTMDVPDAVASTVSTIFVRFMDDPPMAVIPRGAAVMPPMMAPRRVIPPPAAAPAPPPPPPEAAIEQLTSMGFEREAVLRALRASHNNVERAADRLLSGN